MTAAGTTNFIWDGQDVLLEQAEMVRSAGVPSVMIFLERSLTDEDLGSDRYQRRRCSL